MSQLLKRLQKWENNPKIEPPWSQVKSVLLHFGFELEQKPGSHVIVSHDRLRGHPKYGALGAFPIAVKNGQTVKRWYITAILDAINIIGE